MPQLLTVELQFILLGSPSTLELLLQFLDSLSHVNLSKRLQGPILLIVIDLLKEFHLLDEVLLFFQQLFILNR